MAIFELNKSIFHVSLKRDNLLIGVFKHCVLLGQLNDSERFDLDKSFIFYHFQFSLVFHGIWTILKTISGNSTEKNGTFLTHSENDKYSWQLTNSKKIRLNKTNDVACLTFELAEFNDLILIFSRSFLFCLNLKPDEFQLLNQLSDFSLDELVDLDSFAKIDKFLILNTDQLELSGMNILQKNIFSVLIFYHLDIIIVVHKLKCLYNDSLSITKTNVELILET